MQKDTKWMLAGASAGAALAAAAAYGLIARPWHLRWGATREEVDAAMPFDGLIPDANYFTTRAISIGAAPEQVWPFVTNVHALPHGTIIRRAETNRCVVFAPPEVEAEATWVVVLEPRGSGTRLVSRNRARFPSRASAVIRYLLVDPGQFVFERSWMLSVKAAAERASLRVAGGELREPSRDSAQPSEPATRTPLLHDQVQVPELVP